MKKKLDRIIVVDVESTCWEDKAEAARHTSEIIQIGVVSLDVRSLMAVQASEIMVKPRASEVSPFCTKLTGISPEDVKKGISFSEACQLLMDEYETHNRPWASYGDYDRNMFHSNCELHASPDPAARAVYPFGHRH